MRKYFIKLTALFLCLTLTAGRSGADGYEYEYEYEKFPNRPVKIVVVRAAGGSADVVARTFAPYFGKALGVDVEIENIEGSAGRVGLSEVFHTEPDGYTLVLGNFPSYVLDEVIEGGVFYTMSEFEPVAGVSGRESNVLAVPGNSPFNSLHDLMDYDRANRGQLNMAVTSGISNSSLAQALFVTRTGFSAAPILYDDGKSCVAAVIGERVDLAICSGVSVYTHFAEKEVKVLCSFGTHEDDKLPDVPEFSETYGERYSYDVFMGILAPPGTPEDVLTVLRTAGYAAAQDPEYAAAAEKLFNVVARDHNALAKVISDCYTLVEDNRNSLAK